jgi:MFS family permease
MDPRGVDGRWLNRTVVGVGITSFLSDVGHETATALLPLLAADLGSPAVVLGAMEGIADAASGAAKLWAGWLSDRIRSRKPLAIAGYLTTGLATPLLGVAASAWQAVAARGIGWVGRGARSPARSALLAGDVPAPHYGKAFGFERAMDTLGAIAGPFAAAALVLSHPFRTILLWTVVPGLLAAMSMAFLVRERPRDPAPARPFLGAMASLPPPFRRFVLAVGLFGLGDFAHTLLILRAIEILTPSLGGGGAAAAAMALYGLHNVAGAVMALAFGAAGDRFGHLRALALGYLLGPAMIAAIIVSSMSGPAGGGVALAAAFLLGGALLAAEDALESAAAAELLPEDRRGTGFGLLAAINSAGDLLSSLAVGLLWKAAGPG